MKKLIFMLLACFAIVACDETKKLRSAQEEQDLTITDTTVYGVCAEAANYTVLLATVTGDTIGYAIPMDSIEIDTLVVGGMYNGDRLAVIAYKNEDGENVVRHIINLTTIAGKWKNGDRELDLSDGDDWKIFNGQMVAKGDTFSVYDVNPDTLTLETADGIYDFERVE